jgi:excisionase family DNA binding protein
MKEPKNKTDFARWLETEFSELETVCKYEPDDDYYQGIAAAETVETARRLACRFGVDPGEEVQRVTPRAALAIIGRLLDHFTPKPDLLTAKQAAERLGVSPRTVYDLCESGQLRCQRIGTGRGTIRIRPADLDRIPMESTRRLA